MDKQPSAFFLLAREIRDLVYETLLFSPLDSQQEQGQVGPGSCFGMMYSCRQCCVEVLQTIERNRGVPFSLELEITQGKSKRGSENIRQAWILFPLITYSRYLLLTPGEGIALEPATSSSTVPGKCKCQSFHLSFKVQSGRAFQWWGCGGPANLTSVLFQMLAKFLLRGPVGLNKSLPKSSDEGCMWDIDTLVVDVIGVGTTYTDPADGQLCTVPSQLVEHCGQSLGHYLDRVCCAGALAKRVRVVRLLVEGEVKQEWSIDQGKSLPEDIRKEWAEYGWVIERN
ncbi:hypothetical protein GYMLUDRAFT_38624 [Collybiopsis luxurians FD-317 M1]|nr:hypothetical protein GYMLUDRAFT_38624 [Collybiopsis luxurians FD-317 M1]